MGILHRAVVKCRYIDLFSGVRKTLNVYEPVCVALTEGPIMTVLFCDSTAGDLAKLLSSRWKKQLRA